jgi:hypothetical protein
MESETKICGRCDIEKPIDEFGFRYVKLGIRHSWCKSCFVEYKRLWYERNREKHIAHVREARDQMGDENQLLMWQYLAHHPCVECGERDPVVLQFDHLRDKRNDVAYMCKSGFAWSTVLKRSQSARSFAPTATPERPRANGVSGNENT